MWDLGQSDNETDSSNSDFVFLAHYYFTNPSYSSITALKVHQQSDRQALYHNFSPQFGFT